ncbi:conserved protein, unknown function [Plasmodium yoelii]|uniref:Uncharacterized protein n=2 Tax=Plasmodium yoelii TaxID=5861 RepID=A0AAE9WQM0_PLAYO|nr:conserved protein, unknown function [Plasmodium yoelii]WBY54724.1 hypothetical protein Py17XNL_000202643 [Plasmodium yoelii yoelii]CDU16090.1 conserved Plasmodium protein, unknown function [Plasmodium yoelii]VTZ71715.1 conserved protein, unknown function [Plasmodium yoelii]|eukprot:XP_022811355.1 conserved protein, unknown function [Plasmodium yoelii]
MIWCKVNNVRTLNCFIFFKRYYLASRRKNELKCGGNNKLQNKVGNNKLQNKVGNVCYWGNKKRRNEIINMGTSTYKKSIFYEEIIEKKNAENNMNILKIIKDSTIENLSVYDCTLFLNFLIKNKKNKELKPEIKNVNKIKLTSTLYKESIAKILKNIISMETKYILYFFNKFSDLRDINSLEYLFFNIYNYHLHKLSLYHFVEIFYNIVILNCTFQKNKEKLNKFMEYIIINTINENKNIKNYEKKIKNKINIQIQWDSKKPIHIKSFNKKTKEGIATNILKNKCISINGYSYIIDENTKGRYKRDKEKQSIDIPKYNKTNNMNDLIQPQFNLSSLSNVMIYKLIYSLAKINMNNNLVKELFILLIPYLRYRIQNKNYIYSRERNEMLIKIIWSYAFLHIRDINLFVDFSICIQKIIFDTKLEYLKIVKSIYENLLIFDELLLDMLDDRINEIEKNSPEQFSHPRKKQFKKKKKKIEITDDIKFNPKKGRK